jgi:predicted dehydrogenase
MLDGGKLVCENNKLMLYKLEMREREFNATYKKGFGQPEFEKIDVETDGENPQHNGVLQNFADAILFDKPLIASGCEGIHGLSISNAMHLSSWLGRAVEMPLNEELFFNELTKKIASSKRKNVVSGEVLNIEGTFGS